jgi:hypothetical protein
MITKADNIVLGVERPPRLEDDVAIPIECRSFLTSSLCRLILCRKIGTEDVLDNFSRKIADVSA